MLNPTDTPASMIGTAIGQHHIVERLVCSGSGPSPCSIRSPKAVAQRLRSTARLPELLVTRRSCEVASQLARTFDRKSVTP